jgi:hypothetical protein
MPMPVSLCQNTSFARPLSFFQLLTFNCVFEERSPAAMSVPGDAVYCTVRLLRVISSCSFQCAVNRGANVLMQLLMSDSYLPGWFLNTRNTFASPWFWLLTRGCNVGAMVLAHSLRDSGTKARLAILVTLDSLKQSTLAELRVLLSSDPCFFQSSSYRDPWH